MSDTLVGSSLGGYTLLQLIGSGGMGSVYLAEDPTIGQQVAIKVVRTDDSDCRDASTANMALERFKQEARAIANLDHLHILPLYRYGEEQMVEATLGNKSAWEMLMPSSTSSLSPDQRRAYMVMQYRPEGSLWDWLRQRAGSTLDEGPASSSRLLAGLNSSWPLSIDEAGEYLRQAASALQYAHEHGIVHRDVKPANFLLRLEAGNTIHLMLSDFGLAKFFSASSATSSILGTPMYMAPEQFEGIAVPESDQYALAIMIYLLLAGKPPFQGEPMRMMHQHLNQPPPAIRTMNPNLPAGVESALAKALAKKPSGRYPSMAAFAQAFAAGMHPSLRSFAPQLSLPSSPKVQTNRLATPTPPPLPKAYRLERPPATPALNTQLPVSPVTPNNASMNTQAQISPHQAQEQTPTLLSPPPTQVNAGPGLLSPPSPSTIPPSGVPMALPASFSPTPLPTTPMPSGPPQPPPTSGKRTSRRRALGWIIGGITATAAIGGGVGFYFYLQNSSSSHILHTLRGHTDAVNAVSWSPDGSQLVSGSRDRTARLWTVASEQNVFTYTGHHAALTTVAWSSAGQLIASGGKDKAVRLWNSTGATQHTFTGLGAEVDSVVWNKTGDILFLGTLGAGAKAIAVSTETVLGKSSKLYIHTLALSSDGQSLAAGLEGGTVVLIDLLTLTSKPFAAPSPSHTGRVLALAWSPDGSFLASGGGDSIVQVWNVATGHVVHRLPHQGAVFSVAWDPANTSRLATASADGNVTIWDLNKNTKTLYSGHTDAVTSLAWSTSGLATGSADKTIIIWQT